MNKLITLVASIAATIGLSGCGENLAVEAEKATGSVLLRCQGTRVTKDHVPDRFSLRATSHMETSWYREYFERSVGTKDFLEYASIPGYFEEPPEKLSDRPVSGNTLPYDTYAVSYFYADRDYKLHPMDMYFGSFPEPYTHNASGGVLHFPYSVYLTAPEEARYVVVRVHDTPYDWEYKTQDGEWIKGMEEVWYARPADKQVRTTGITDVAGSPLSSWEEPALSGCRLNYAWEDGRDDLYGGDDGQVKLREDLRSIEQKAVAQNKASGIEPPGQMVPRNSPGMSQAQNPKGKLFGFPLIGFSREEAVAALSSGDIDTGWEDGLWHRPLL